MPPTDQNPDPAAGRPESLPVSAGGDAASRKETIVRFTYRTDRGGYTCDTPGDCDGSYVRLEDYEKLKAERDDALSGNEGRMFRVWLQRMQEKHGSQPEGGTTWHEMPCQHCREPMLWDNGDTNDMTAMDISSVKCWKCGKVNKLDPKMPDDEAEELASKTLPSPTKMRRELDEAQAREAIAGLKAMTAFGNAMADALAAAQKQALKHPSQGA